MEQTIKKTPVAGLLAWGGIAQLWKNASKVFESPPPAATQLAPEKK